MKSSLKKRIKKLQTRSSNNSQRPRYAKVIYDSTSSFDPSKLEVDAEVVLCLPDNGRRDDNIDFSERPYHITYGY
jgi:hypothetical protein